MKKYTFYFDGINKTISVIANNKKSAKASIWNNLSDSEKNCTSSIECIDEEQI